MTKSKMKITYAIIAAALAVALSSSSITPVLAANPHYVSATASIDRNGNLVCSFKEAGLGNTPVTVSETCSAQATALYQCFNRGGNHPQADNKEVGPTAVSASGPFTSGKNGQITGQLTVAPPSAGGFTCPGGQALFLERVSYNSITLESRRR